MTKTNNNKAQTTYVVHAYTLGTNRNFCNGTEDGHVVGECGYEECCAHKNVTCPDCLAKESSSVVPETLSLESFIRAANPLLEQLSREFDAMSAQMQNPESQEGTRATLKALAAEFGKAAVAVGRAP
jgi:hypothetical protein